MNYTFVTVVFEEDLEFLRLQARSLNLYLDRDLLAEIIIVDNRKDQTRTEWRDTVRGDFGDLRSLVRVVSAAEVADIPAAISGWISQMILKLAVARRVQTDRYVMLDAKNHLVSPLTRICLESGDKIRSWVVSYKNHPLRSHYENAMNYFGIDPVKHLAVFPPAITPYTAPTVLVQELTEYVENRERKPFPQAFSGLKVTEFLLLDAFLAKRALLDRLYEFSVAPGRTVWEESAKKGVGEITRLIESCSSNDVPFFALHRRAARQLDQVSAQRVAAFWQSRHLFGTTTEAMQFLATVRDAIMPGRRNYQN